MIAEVYPSPDGWRFRVKGGNNEIMCTGEAYVRRIDAESALRVLFGMGKSLEVVVRNHHQGVEDHYVLGKVTVEDIQNNLDEVYTGPLEDTTNMGETGEEP